MAEWWKSLMGDDGQPLEQVFEGHARAGNGQFAIAYALLQVARAIGGGAPHPAMTAARDDDEPA